MKKLLSILLVASLLAISVACMFAVSADEDAVVVNFLEQFKDADTDDYTIKNNGDGTVSVTFKRAVTSDNPVTIVEAFSDATIDLSDQLYWVVNFASENTDVDFYLHYTRADKGDKYADLYWTGARGVDASVVTKTDKLLVWDINAYITGTKLFDDKKHTFADLTFTVAAEGLTVTFYSLAIVDDKDAMEDGVPVAGASTTNSGNNSSTSSNEENTSSEASTSSTSSTTPPTGDAGVIVFAVLGVLAVVGCAAAVRARH